MSNEAKVGVITGAGNGIGYAIAAGGYREVFAGVCCRNFGKR